MILSLNKEKDLQYINNLFDKPLPYAPGVYLRGEGIFIENEADYDKFILLYNKFYNKDGEFNKYVKLIPRSFLNFIYTNIENYDDGDIVLLDLYGYKKDGHNLSDFRFFIKNEIKINGKLLFILIKNDFYKNKYLLLLNALFENYKNDIIKNKQFLIYKILKVFEFLKLY